jgi:hypothetical protein
MIKTKKEYVPFQPNTRGDISAATANTSALQYVAPESPRPTEMLSGVRIDGTLTHRDLALHDLLVSKAYETDKAMPDQGYSIPLSDVLHFLGQDARKEHVLHSLKKMKNCILSFTAGSRQFEGVQMLVSWQEVDKEKNALIGYEFPAPIRTLMQHMPQYGYIELAAIGQSRMTSKYSHAFYKWLVSELIGKKWNASDNNRHVVEISPDNLAEIIDFPSVAGSVPFSKLNQRVLSHLYSDLKAVERFELVNVKFDGLMSPRRGRAVEKLSFHIRMREPSHHTIRATDVHLKFDKDVRTGTFKPNGNRVGGADADEYRVNSVVFMRAVKMFGKELVINHLTAHWSWQVVLQEALDGDGLTDGYHSRECRGKRLLDLIKTRGADHACVSFFAEEARLGADIVGSRHVAQRLPKAEKARIKRFKDGKLPKPIKEHKAKPAAKQKTVQAIAVEQSDNFENVGHFQAEIDPSLSEQIVDDFVFSTVAAFPFSGEIERLFRLYLTEDEDKGLQTFIDIDIKPADDDEFQQCIKQIEPWLISGSVTYMPNKGV